MNALRTSLLIVFRVRICRGVVTLVGKIQDQQNTPKAVLLIFWNIMIKFAAANASKELPQFTKEYYCLEEP